MLRRYLRILTGRECVSVVVTSPSGMRHNVVTEFAEPSFRATLNFLEAGQHRVQVRGRVWPKGEAPSGMADWAGIEEWRAREAGGGARSR